MLLIIFGAGASYDSVPHLAPCGKQSQVIEHSRPPLANQLFENREAFVNFMVRFGDCRALIPRLRLNTPVEDQLQRFQLETKTFPERHCQLAAIRFYLHSALWNCQSAWHSRHNGINNYTTFLDVIERWRFEESEQVCFVTFNYDTMLERAIQQVLRITFDTFSQYILYPAYRLFKLHGSIDWALEVEGIESGTGPDPIIKKASDLKFRAYQKVIRPDVQIAGNITGFPALAIPATGKNEFFCPSEHVQSLRDLIPGVTKIISVGWRGTEQRFTEMLKYAGTGSTTPLDIMIISGDMTGANETSHNLGIKNLTNRRELVETGFTGLINEIDRLESFLRR